MSPPVDLTKVRWLALCEQADIAAVGSSLSGRAADDLPIAAGRLTTVTPLPHVPADTALLTSFRWDCTAYGLAQPITRRLLAPGLQAKAQLVRLLLTPPEPTRGAEAMPVPEAPFEEHPNNVPAWTRRADIGG